MPQTVLSNVKKLLFVYNADSGVLNSIKDGIIKITDPEGYECRLCALTYGVATMKGEWRRFIKSLPVDSVFLHRDEFKEKYGETELPATFLDEDGELTLIISSDEYNELTTLRGLQSLVRTKLRTHGII